MVPKNQSGSSPQAKTFLLERNGSENQGRCQIKLCLASRLFYPTYSGSALRFLRYLPGFSSRGIDVRVFAGTPAKGNVAVENEPADWQFYAPEKPSLPKIISGVPVHHVKLPDEGYIRRNIAYMRALTNFCQQPGFRPDLIQLLDGMYIWSIPWLLKLRSLNIPIVYTHTLIQDPPANPIKQRLHPLYWWLPFALVDRVVVSSTVMRDTLQNHGITTPMEVIPNGVDLARFNPEPTPDARKRIRRALNIGDDASVLLTIGAVEPRKGTDLLLEAWGQLAANYPNLHLIIAGPRHDLVRAELGDFRQRIQSLVAAAGHPNRLHFTGYVENVQDYLHAADIFVFPSQREGMGNVVMEAMASGLPVILTPYIGLPEEFGQPGRHYTLVDRDPDTLSDAIHRLLASNRVRVKMRQLARQRVEEELDVELSLDRYAALYQNLAATPQAGLDVRTERFFGMKRQSLGFADQFHDTRAD